MLGRGRELSACRYCGVRGVAAMREGKNGSKASCCRVAEVVMGRCMGMSLQGSVKGVQYCGRLRILQDGLDRGAGK